MTKQPNNEIKIPMIDQSIFREYDIRGIVPTQINDTSYNLISHAIARKCNDENINELALGRDGRLSGEKILNLLSQELQISRYSCCKYWDSYQPASIFCS